MKDVIEEKHMGSLWGVQPGRPHLATSDSRQAAAEASEVDLLSALVEGQLEKQAVERLAMPVAVVLVGAVRVRIDLVMVPVGHVSRLVSAWKTWAALQKSCL
jgi:hypothetical protein